VASGVYAAVWRRVRTAPPQPWESYEATKGNPVPGGVTGPLYSWEKYIREPSPPSWGSLKIENIKYGHEPRGTQARESLRQLCSAS
jgi:hypothetical protein